MTDNNVTPFKQRLQVTQPAPLSMESIQRPLYAGKEVLFCWCSETGFGGMYSIEQALWTTWGPFPDYDAFMRHLRFLFPEVFADLEKELH